MRRTRTLSLACSETNWKQSPQEALARPARRPVRKARPAGWTGSGRTGEARRARALVDDADPVFCGPLGDPLDGSAIRRRLKRTQVAAGLRPLRFHDLRHSFGSLVVRDIDTATLKEWMGHSKLSTTERYLHAKPRHSDVARLDRVFGGTVKEAASLEESNEGSEV